VNTPTLSEVIAVAVGARLAEVNVAIPASVESYDRTTQKASVKPLIRAVRTDSDGTRVAESRPVINDVPVVFPGAGAYSITFPLAAGDTVLLVFSQASLDKWLAAGGEVDPLDPRRFALSDAVAIPGLRPFSAPVEDTDATAMVLQSGGEIHAGGSSSLATKADIDALKTYIAMHAHTGVTTGGGTSGPPSSSPPSADGTSILKGA
jgi:hypothetical protein